jgi:SAM-dependent methyltransferase
MGESQLAAGLDLYRCSRCHGSLEGLASNGLGCAVCRADYPLLNGVRVLMPCRNHLRQTVQLLAQVRQEVAQQQAKLATEVGRGHSPAARAAARDGYDRQLANLDLIERCMAPVKAYLAARPPRPGSLGELSFPDLGWPSFKMLGYFYRDWGHTAEARYLTSLFADAVEKHCARRESVAVLGCGACRLVYDLAELFATVLGIDVAIDSLMLAKALLDGEVMEINFNFPSDRIPLSQRSVRLSAAPPRGGTIELVNASVNRLPLATGSVSCVATQSLLDALPEPAAAVAEIRRVLAPGGTWLNFALLTERNSPPTVRAFDQLNNLDLPSSVEQAGFTLLEQAMHRHSPVDLSGLSPWARTETWSPVFFVARKSSSGISERRDYFGEYFAGKSDEVWSRVPRTASYVALIEEKAFSGEGMETRKRVAAFSADNSRQVTDETAVTVERLLRQLDGKATMKDLLTTLTTARPGLPAVEFMDLFSELEASGIVRLQ